MSNPNYKTMKIQTLGSGLLYQVERKRDRMIASMERRTTLWLLSLIAVCIAIAFWNLMR